MSATSRQTTLAKRIRDRLLRKPLRRFRCDPAGRGRTLLIRMDLINRCNMRCFMCPYPEIHKARRPAQTMEPALFETIAGQVFPHCYHVTLSCAYEPLLNPHLDQILEIASRHEVPEIGMVTNGSLLKREITEAMIRHRLTVLSVSLDGVKPETCRSIRGVDAFDKILGNVRDLQDLKREAESELPHLFMNFVLMRRNVDEIVPYLGLCRELGATDVTFVHVTPRSPENAESLINAPDLYAQVYREARRIVNEGPMRVLLPAPFSDEELAKAGCPDRERRLQQSRSDDLLAFGGKTSSLPVEDAGDDVYCASPWTMLFISPNGDVHPCGHRQNNPPFGSFATQSFEEIWNGPAFLNLRRELYDHNLEGTCLKCESLTPNEEPFVRRPVRIF